MVGCASAWDAMTDRSDDTGQGGVIASGNNGLWHHDPVLSLLRRWRTGRCCDSTSDRGHWRRSQFGLPPGFFRASKPFCPFVEAVCIAVPTLFATMVGMASACGPACNVMIEKTDRPQPGGGHRADPSAAESPSASLRWATSSASIPASPGVAHGCGDEDGGVLRRHVRHSPIRIAPTMCRWWLIWMTHDIDLVLSSHQASVVRLGGGRWSAAPEGADDYVNASARFRQRCGGPA